MIIVFMRCFMQLSQISQISSQAPQQDVGIKRKLNLGQDVHANADLSQIGQMTADFQQVLNLLNQKEVVQPKVEPKQDVKEDLHVDQQKLNAVKNAKPDTSKAQDVQQKQDAQQAQQTQQNQQTQQAQQTQKPVEQAQAISQAISAIQALSSEDLMKLLKVQENTNLEGQMQVELSNELVNEHPQIKSLNPNQLLALTQLLANQNQATQVQKTANVLDLPHLEAQISQNLQALSQSNNQFQNLFAQINQHQVQNQNVGQNQLVAQVEQLVRPQQHQPSINQIQLTESQKNSVIRQISQTFKNQVNQKQVTEIRLHPEELGMVKLKVEMQGNDVKVWFSAEKSSVNETLAQNIEQLRLALFKQDFNLAQASILKDASFNQRNSSQNQQNQNSQEQGDQEEKINLQHKPKASKTTRMPGRFRTTV
jgi:flagellar hook-length control protein FliK